MASTPSALGDLGFSVSAVFPYTTSTARQFVRTSDTGTVLSTSRVLDLGRLLTVGTTGGKPLDATVHRRAAGPPRWKSVLVSIPLELTFHSSGKNTYVQVAHKHRAATAGAGSTWETIKTDLFRFKMGTDTDATFHTGVKSAANLMAGKRYYKANVSFIWKTTSSTAAKDTTTEQELICNSASILLSGAESPQDVVPFKVS